jgi:hypothetical protein
VSVQAISWVLDHSTTEGKERLVLISLANHAGMNPINRAWEAWPGVETIRCEANIGTERTTQRTIARLVEGGHIEVVVNGAPDSRVRGDRRPNLYRILIDGVTAGVTPQDAARGDIPSTDGVTESSARGDTAVSPEPKENQLRTESLADARDAGSSSIDDVHAQLIDSLCSMLADKIQQHRGEGSPRPAITERWRKDMRLLVERGPLHVERPTPIPMERVVGAMKVVFGELNEPEGRRAFCWADQIRSPAALRDHWLQIADAAKRARQRRAGPTATMIERHAVRERRAAAESQQPLGSLLELLPGKGGNARGDE